MARETLVQYNHTLLRLENIVFRKIPRVRLLKRWNDRRRLFRGRLETRRCPFLLTSRRRRARSRSSGPQTCYRGPWSPLALCTPPLWPLFLACCAVFLSCPSLPPMRNVGFWRCISSWRPARCSRAVLTDCFREGAIRQPGLISDT